MMCRLFSFSSALILVATLFSSAASAQLTTEQLSVTVGRVVGGSDSLQATLLSMTGSGSFTYDASLLGGSGFESINASRGLMVELDILGQTFTEASDQDLTGDFPVASFEDSQPLFLSLRVSESSFVNNPTAIAQAGIGYFEFDSPLMPNQSGGFDIALNVIAVPEPSNLVHLLWIGVVVFGVRRKR